MIWVDGRIVPDDALKISVLDRTFEHGLGLFETFRTWNGRAVLLDRHLERLRSSAERLRLPLDESALPGPSAVAELFQAKGFEGDAAYRITMSGGLSEEGGSILWITARPLPAPLPSEGVELVLRGIMADCHDPLARFKTLNYWQRRIAATRAQWSHHEGERTTAIGPGAREALLLSPDGRVWEGSRTNIFVIRDDVLITPGPPGPFVSGIMRGVVLERSPVLGLAVRLEDLTLDSLRTASEVFLTNSLRGIIPVRAIDEREFDAPGPWTRAIRDDVLAWVQRGGDES